MNKSHITDFDRLFDFFIYRVYYFQTIYTKNQYILRTIFYLSIKDIIIMSSRKEKGNRSKKNSTQGHSNSRTPQNCSTTNDNDA